MERPSNFQNNRGQQDPLNLETIVIEDEPDNQRYFSSTNMGINRQGKLPPKIMNFKENLTSVPQSTSSKLEQLRAQIEFFYQSEKND